MLSNNDVKAAKCPQCGNAIPLRGKALSNSLLFRQPLVCSACHKQLSLNPLTVLILLLFSLALVALGVGINFYLADLQQLQQIYPNLKSFALLTVVAAALISSVLFRFFIPPLIEYKQHSTSGMLLHYSALLSACSGFALIALKVVNTL